MMHLNKLRIAVDSESKHIIPFRITKKGTVNDTKKFVPLIKEILKITTLPKVYADKVYDSTTNFNLLDKLPIEPVLYIKNNDSCKRTRNGDQEINRYI
jgi:hypothetical protein